MISVPGADDDVDARLHVRIAGLADAAMRPSLMPTSALKMPPVVERSSALVITVSAAAAPPARWLWPMPSRITLPPPNLTSSP